MRDIPFSSFENRLAGRTAIVVGKGPTLFEYADIAKHAAPVFFVNDAVALEKHVAPGESSFLFAHDTIMTVWFTRGIKSAAVIPEDGKVVAGRTDAKLEPAGDVVFYKWRTSAQDTVLGWDRRTLAAERELYTDCGTIHSLLHFVWFCGCTGVRFIGCDGVTGDPRTAQLGDGQTGYDKRIANASNSAPWGQFIRIRREQDRLCRLFGFDVEYWGSPVERSPLTRTSEAVRATIKDLKRSAKRRWSSKGQP
jgi:hypothetical protein